MRPNLEAIVGNLSKARAGLLGAADSIPGEQWKTNPSVGGWSAGELVAHLIMVERTIISSADRIVKKPPKVVPFLKKFHLPMALVEARLVRSKTPIPLDAQLVRNKEEMFAELRAVRERSLAFIAETRNRDLSAYRWPHPFIGSLNTYQWFQMIASHEVRHTKQMKEISASLPNCVAGLQK